MKDKESHDLFKVPDYVIVKELRVELGEKNSYIDELEYTIKKLSKKKINLDHITNLKGQIDNLKRKLKDCRSRLYDQNHKL